MRFVKGILRKIDHFVIYFISNFLGNAVCNTTLNTLGFITIYEVLAFCLHDLFFFLSHRTAYQIASAKTISGQTAHDLHYLLLIHNTAIRRCQDRLKLRAVIHNAVTVIFALYILWNEIHRTRTVQRISCQNIFHTLWFKLRHKALHATAFQLEDTVRLTGTDHVKHFFVIKWNAKKRIVFDSCHFSCILYDC